MDSFAQGLPSQNLEAEQAVLSAVIQSREALQQTIHTLEGTDFYSPKHGDLWEAIRAMALRGEPVDVVTLDSELKTQGRLEETGGAGYLAQLVAFNPAPGNAAAYAEIVAGCAMKRRIGAVAERLAAQSRDATVPPGDLQSLARRELSTMLSLGRQSDDLRDLSDLLDWWDSRHEAAAREEAVPGAAIVYTGIGAFDQFCPLTAGELAIVAGRPGAGKSQFARHLAMRIAGREAGNRVLLYSLEMDRNQLYPRLVAAAAGLNMHKVRISALTEEDWDVGYAHSAKLMILPLYVSTSPTLTSGGIYTSCVQAAARYGPPRLVVVDYLQLLRDRPTKEQRRDQLVGEMTRTLRQVAKELHVPVVVLAQLNRQVEQRGDKIPQLSDLRESGDLEQDADLVLFVHRPEMYSTDTKWKGLLQLIVGKQRQGPTGHLWFHFDLATGRITELPKRDWPAPGKAK